MKVLVLLKNTENAAACVMHKTRLDNLMTPLGLRMSDYEFEVAIGISSSFSEATSMGSLCGTACTWPVKIVQWASVFPSGLQPR